MTDRSTWIAEKKQTDRLMTPEGQAQDCLGHSLPAAVLREAQADPLWNTQPETVTKVTLYTSVLEQARARLARLRSWQKLFDTYVREQAGTPLLAWAGNTAHSLAHGRSNPETNAGLFSVKAQEVFLSFIRDQCQCVFRIGDVNSEEKPVFSAGMREVIKCLPECTPELWSMAQQKAIPAPLTAEEKYRLNMRSLHALDREMQERADMVNAIFTLCGSFQNPNTEATREQELTALCAVGRAFHCSACTGRSLPEEMQPGFRLFKRLIALRKEMIRIASAAADWEWIANQNPDIPADELTKIVTEAYREDRWPRGKLNVDYGTWHNLLNDGQMAVYPEVRHDTLYILSAQNNSLGLWRVL